MAHVIAHGLIVIALVVCYTIVSVTGGDGNPLLGVLAGYLGGAGTTIAVAKANGGIR